MTARPDWWALFSLALAMLGAFTIVGTTVATGTGIVALIRIRRNPGTRTGSGYALTAIALSVSMTGAAVAGYHLQERWALGAWLREVRLTGQLARSERKPITTSDGACVLQKLPPGWRIFLGSTRVEPALDDLQQITDALVIHPSLRVYLDMHRVQYQEHVSLSDYLVLTRQELSTPRKPLLGDDDEENPFRANPTFPIDIAHQTLAPLDGLEGREWIFDLKRGATTWRFLQRVYRKPKPKAKQSTTIYQIRIYAPRDRFLSVESELRALADSIRFDL